ncbi:ribosomal protein S5 domain 2-type protein [Pseudomassariella vexata]|uniref:Ribosomal RNA-processing protein 42 n=1 Tax=Pseudomassariella vexata TaxID=1141098 RepID=A0A1Y2DYJ3_9PEZI|nr:ribosomal protein S5 domain 2-type protein [Pseudomassariella vexata]ORY64378.1 ribosomal protein S5 domain 2-type protein [Pseudomassariella vexata]
MSTTQHLLLSPAELAYLHSTLSLVPPIRPDSRSPTQFRPLTAETGILPGTNGSARVCFADGTEAMVGVKAEVEKTPPSPYAQDGKRRRKGDSKQDDADEAEQGQEIGSDEAVGEADWVEMSVEIPGYRDDDSSTVFLATMLSEALLADGEFAKKLWINRRFHWKLYLDIILISPPLSYPLPLLSLTTHLALLSTRLPRLKSELDEDPMFDDDWAASTFLYPRQRSNPSKALSRPPITLLVMAVGNNIIFDPSKEELAVADSALAVSVSEGKLPQETAGEHMDVDEEAKPGRSLRLLSVRTIDPPSRLTPPGVPNSVNASAWGQDTPTKNPDARTVETEDVAGVWKAPRGGAKSALLSTMVQTVLDRGGVADEVLDALEGVELG